MSSLTSPPEADWSKNPANARNWSLRRKIYNTAVPSFLCLVVLVIYPI
jgi:hypothetical protein